LNDALHFTAPPPLIPPEQQMTGMHIVQIKHGSLALKQVI